MCPVSLGTSRSIHALETGEAKLWLLLIGVDCYSDDRLPELRYSALDCKGVGEALSDATQTFPQKEAWIYHDAGAQTPSLEKVRASLQHISTCARERDTVLLYFSGHGVLDPDSQQPVLCLADTWKDRLLETGLSLRELLDNLHNCEARSQVVWLDACHSGGMTWRGAKGTTEPLLNPTLQLVEGLRQRAAQSRGFYAFLSCDRDQQSWEFPQLEHGVFSYFLMRGLRGEAADAQGIIEADRLYRYVYYQTLQYIDKTNQQLRLINQQKRGRGESQLHTEYPLQTPKRIVEGIGELILGLKPQPTVVRHPRQALVVDGLGGSQTSLAISRELRGLGDFELDYFPSGKDWTGLQNAIKTCFSYDDAASLSTAFLYLRGRIEETETGEALLVLGEEVRLSRSWLRQVLRRSTMAQQVVILDCPGARYLDEWIEDLQIQSEKGQCLIAAAAHPSQPEAFTTALLETMRVSDLQTGLSVAGWIAQLQVYLSNSTISPHIWLSGTQGAIEILPSRMAERNVEYSASGIDLNLCPYMGLKAFSEDDSQFFFGRERLAQKLLNELDRNVFLAIVGASGSGKSSVLQAGVMAQLRQGKQIPESESWWVRSFRPGVRPLDALAWRLVDSGSEQERIYQHRELKELLSQGVEGFVCWLRSRPEPMVILAVDQFEEIFTLANADERQQFLDIVLGAFDHAGDRFKLIITLRTDFIAPCLEIPPLARLLQASSVLVPPYLNETDYRQIIVKPAEKVGLKVEPELVEVLLQELSHASGDLPLLEFVLEQVWQHRQPGKLTLQVYQQQIGGLKGALEKRAQAIYDAMDSEAKACARWIFLALTQLGEGTEDTRRRVLKSELVVAKYPASLVDRTLQALTTAKLVVVSLEAEAIPVGQSRDSSGYFPKPEALLQTQSQEVMVEVAHEILIRHWSTLRGWLQENRDRLRVQRQIEQAALQWKVSDRQADFLLRGVQLASAEEIYLQYADELSEDVRQFIEAGLQHRDAQQRQTKRQLQQARLAIAAIATLALISAGFGALVYRQRQEARFKWINSLTALSEAQLKSNSQLEALLSGVKSGQQLRQKPLFEAGFSPTAEMQLKTIATLQQALDRGRESNRLEGHSQRVNSVVFSPDGKTLVSGSDDKTIKVWRLDGTIVKQFDRQSSRIVGVAFSPEVKAIVVVDGNSNVYLCSEDKTKLLTTIRGNDKNLKSIAIGANGRMIAVASDRTIKLSKTTDGSSIKTLDGHKGEVTAIALSPDDKTLVSASADGTIKLWSLKDGKAKNLLQDNRDRINSISFNPNRKILATGNADGTINIWNFEGTLLTTLKGHNAEVTSLSFNPDGQQLLSGSADISVRIWNLPKLENQAIASNLISLSPDGKLLATTTKDGTIQLWQRQENNALKLFKTLAKSISPILGISFSPDGKTLALNNNDKTIQLWNVTDGSLQNTFKGSGGNAIAFSPSSNLLASANDRNEIELWQEGTLLKTLAQQEAKITALSFSRDGQILAVAGEDNLIKLWQVKDGKLLNTLTGHLDNVTSLTFSPDGQILASGSADKTIKLWNLADGTLVKTLLGHPDEVKSVTFSSDKQTLYSASQEIGVKVWNFNLDNLITRSCDRLKDYLKNNPNVKKSDRETCLKPS